jgi:hypothetical protein
MCGSNAVRCVSTIIEVDGAGSVAVKSNFKLYSAAILTLAAVVFDRSIVRVTGFDDAIQLKSSPVIHLLIAMQVVACVVTVAYIEIKRHRHNAKTDQARKQRPFDWGTVLLRAITPALVAIFLKGAAIWGNKAFDPPPRELTFVVTDVFVVERTSGSSRRDWQYVALSVGEEFGTNRIWWLHRTVDLNRYRIGQEIAVAAHDGYLGISWCEFEDQTFHTEGDVRQLTRSITFRRSSAKARRAHGRFSPDSPYARLMQESWGIPVQREGNEQGH